MSRTVRGRHRPVRVLGQRAGAATVAASPLVQPHVTPDQPDRRRVPGPPGSAPSKSFAVIVKVLQHPCVPRRTRLNGLAIAEIATRESTILCLENVKIATVFFKNKFTNDNHTYMIYYKYARI